MLYFWSTLLSDPFRVKAILACILWSRTARRRNNFGHRHCWPSAATQTYTHTPKHSPPLLSMKYSSCTHCMIFSHQSLFTFHLSSTYYFWWYFIYIIYYLCYFPHYVPLTINPFISIKYNVYYNKNRCILSHFCGNLHFPVQYHLHYLTWFSFTKFFVSKHYIRLLYSLHLNNQGVFHYKNN